MSFYNDFIKPPLVLTLICAVVTTSLVATESITTPIIEQQKIDAANAARAEVMPKASKFEKIEVTELPDGAIDIYKGGEEGYVVTGSARGYGGVMKVMVGIDNSGTMTGAKVLEHTETKGLGSRVAEPEFAAQFVGSDMEMKNVETISGVTVSSRAFMNSVKSAYQLFGQVAGVKVGGGEPVRDPLTLDAVQKIYPDAKTFVRLDTALESYKVGEDKFIVVTTEPGFQDDIVAAVGFDSDAKITGISFTKLAETPEYGMKLGAADYLAKYVGKSSADEVEGIAGATVTSTAFKKLVNKTVEAMPEVKTAAEPKSLIMLREMMAKHGEKPADFGAQGAKYAIRTDGVQGFVMTAEGFGGEFEVVVIIDNDCKVLEVALGKNDETEGYGSKAGSAEYAAKYVGATTESIDNVETISGATVTSTSFRSAVKNALAIVKGA